MDHQNLSKMNSTYPMLPKDEDSLMDEKPVVSPQTGLGKTLVREDTVMGTFPGCVGCGRGQFTCSSVHKQWSVLCWGQHSDKKFYTFVILLSAVFVLSLIGSIFFCFTNTVNDAILSNMVIRNNSLAYSVWKKPNVQPLMKIHLFNYTNWIEVSMGMEKKLKVQEVGPYVYTQQLERVNVKFEGDKLSFQERSYFTYRPERSKGAIFDKVFVPNLPLLGVASKANDMNLAFGIGVGANVIVSRFNHNKAFVELPVHNFLWGYQDDIITNVKHLWMLGIRFPYDQFGLLVSKNRTLSDRFTINTGENDMNKMNVIEKVNGRSCLNFWSTPECNSIEASDGSIFPPAMMENSSRPLYVFFPNLCRRLPFVYDRDVENSDGIRLLRYRMPLNAFDDPKHNPENQCYCNVERATCPPRGVINVTQCTMGAPALVSFPHFYLGDPALLTKMDGLRPLPGVHDSYFDIHPKLGLTLNGKSSLQINMQVWRPQYFNNLLFLEPGQILPVAWIEMSVDELPRSLKSLIYHGTYSTAAAQLGLIIISLLALILSSLCLFVLILGRRKKPCAVLKKVTLNSDIKLVHSS